MNAVSSAKIVAVLVVIGCLMTALPARAVSAFDFEDGTLQGWLSSTTGGVGSTGVEMHNLSLAAFARHTGDGSHSVSFDFPYSAASLLSFDMHGVAVAVSTAYIGVAHAQAGVTVSFFNGFNVPLGTMRLLNVTTPTWLGPNDYSIDSQQHHYLSTMGDFAQGAGLAANAPIATISLAFGSTSQFVCGGNCVNSNATVWFDNVVVSAVPESTERTLLLVGLATVAIIARRQRLHGRPCKGLRTRMSARAA